MFLSTKNLGLKNKNNLFKLVTNITNRNKFKFSLNKEFSVFMENNNEQINQQTQDNNVSIDNFFSQNEQYILNFYKKHKENFLYQEKHDREFENFLSKMEMLISKEGRTKRQVINYLGSINKISIQGREPLREVLIYYQQFVTQYGFNSEVLSETLLHLGQVFQSRENFHRVYHDFSHWEYINSYRMYHIIEDLKFALTNETAYFTADQIAKSVKGLTLSGYKNTKLVDLILEKVKCMLENKKMTKEAEVSYAHTPGAGKSRFIESNSNAEDVFYQKDFKRNVWKLMQIKINEQDNDASSKLSGDKITDKTEEDILGTIKEIIGLLKETKEIQHELTDTFDNLLDQYYKIEQALLENPELKYNQYIKFEVYKLQDKLIEAGYVSIDTIKSLTNKKLSTEELEKMKFNNMVTVLKDFALMNSPNLYNSGEQTLDSLLEKDSENNLDQFELNSSLYRIDDRSLGRVLTALSEYCKITNIDINGEDYCNSKLVKDFPIVNTSDKEHIKFKVEYTKLYHNVEKFMKEINSEITRRVAKSEDLAGLGYIYYAYVNMNNSASNEMKIGILNRINQLAKIKSITDALSNEEIHHLVVGLAKGGVWNEEIRKSVEKIVGHLNAQELFKIEDKINLLWGMSCFKLYTNDSYIQILIKLSENSDSLLNYVTNIQDSDNLLKLYQLSLSLKYEAKDITIPSNLSFLIELYSNLQSFYSTKAYLESQVQGNVSLANDLLADPLKETLLNGIKEGILDKEIQRKQAESLSQLENLGLIEKLPFNPNFVFGFYGHKIALFVLGKDLSTDDNANMSGLCKLTKRILKEQFNTNAVFIQTSQFIDFDLNTVMMQFKNPNNDSSVSNHLDNLIAKQFDVDIEYQKLNQVNKYLNMFIKKFANSEVGEIIFNTESNEKLELFLNSLWQVLDLHSDIVYAYHPSLLERKIVDIKVALARNKLLYDIMSENFKNYVNGILRELIGAEKITYESFIENLNKNYNLIKVSGNVKSKKSNLAIVDDWVGKRLFVDLIKTRGTDKENLLKDKNISVEFINNNFMWFGGFNSYADWEEELKTVYDNLNYFVENSKNKFLFNSHKLGNRNVPQGIFPHPNKFREMKKPAYEINQIEGKNSYELELKKYANLNEQIIMEEIKKNGEQSSISNTLLTEEISLKVNLLNIKNSLKQNLNDDQIIKFLTNFEFIDKLTEEHVNYFSSYSQETNKESNFLSRNPKDFLNFYKTLALVKGQYDEYDKFIMREYYNEQKLFELDATLSPKEKQERMEERMRKKLEENEDNDALSIYNPNIIDYNFDIKSILSSEKVTEIDSDLEKQNHLRNPELFLLTKRIQAERNLILLKIVVKLLNNIALSETERKYIKSLAAKAEKCNLNNIELLGMKNSVTDLTFAELSPNDLYSLNCLYNVEINEKANKFSLSELCLELSHFVDNSTINKILHEVYGQLHLKDFDLGNNSNESKKISLFDVENKEPSLISNEIKEAIWRVSGFFNDEDKNKIKSFLKIKRGKSKFDRIWLELDEKSFEDFINESNSYEDRIKYMEKWIKRKEKEYENRVALPPDNLVLSDRKINNLIEKKDKAYRKTLLFKIFNVDNLNNIPSRKLNEFINEFISNLYLFNFNYPNVIKDIFNALEDVPSIFEEDRQLLSHYRLFFKIDENNPFEFLAVDPVKLNSEKSYFDKEVKEIGDIFNSKLFTRLENASAPVIPIIAERFLNQK